MNMVCLPCHQLAAGVVEKPHCYWKSVDVVLAARVTVAVVS